ncbi:MAG: sugar transferase [Clostridiales bacterium]|nr:sugar transferase [Clostridiales bacterium]
MKRYRQNGFPFFTAIAAGSLLGLMVGAFIAGVYVEQALWSMPDRVNFKQSLPWFTLFTLGFIYFNNILDFSRGRSHAAFSAFVSIILINICMMALPFFEVLYYLQITTLFVIILFELILTWIWICVFHRLWLLFNPPLPTVVFCGDPVKGKEIADKISKSQKTNRAYKLAAYDETGFLTAADGFDSVVLVDPPPDMKNMIALFCWENEKELFIVPDIYELIVNNAAMTQFDDLMTYKAKSIGLTQEQRLIKRTADILISVLALTLLSPLYLIIAIIVKRDGGPVIYSQKRITRGGREFNLYKFRTMIPDAEKNTGPVLSVINDSRVTKTGKWLRQCRLDELPQFFNALKGDMSVVGPRPERPHFIEKYLETNPEYQYRTKVRAGITGLAHVMGKYNTTPEERIKLDLTYIQNYSFLLDLKIILETFRVIFTKEFAEGVENPMPTDTADAVVKKDFEKETV